MNDASDRAQKTTVVPISVRPTLLVGAILRERYVLEQVLGEGGMGRVFLATDREVEGPDRFVAIKVLGELFREHPQSLSVLRKEATNTRKLTHPNIVRVHTFDRDGQNVFIVMEYIRGESLDHFIKRHKEGLAFRDAWPIMRDCAAALAYMHSKDVVHSDFKPGNVFYSEDGEIKVLDLGLARTIDETVALDGRTRFDAGASSPQPLGLTPEYASCEMWEPGTKPDPRDDIYALGCVVYQLLTGRHPYDGLPAPRARAQQLVPTKPKGIRRRQWRTLQQSLSFDRAARTLSVDLFLKEFDLHRPKASATPWIVLTLILVVLGVAAAILFRPPSADAQFIDDEIASHPIGDRKAANPDDILGWKGQARNGLDLAKSAFKTKDYATAAYYLHDGPTNARFSFGRLLAKSSTPQDLRVGAQGMLELSKLYTIPATDLRATNPQEALRWTCLGLQVNPYEEDLRLLYAELEKSTGGVDTDSCAKIDWKTLGPP